MAIVDVDSDVAIDWMACELIESVPGKVSGRPVVRGTRIMPDAIVGSYILSGGAHSFTVSTAVEGPPCRWSRRHR